jgi:hypothetical protein
MLKRGRCFVFACNFLINYVPSFNTIIGIAVLRKINNLVFFKKSIPAEIKRGDVYSIHLCSNIEILDEEITRCLAEAIKELSVSKFNNTFTYCIQY